MTAPSAELPFFTAEQVERLLPFDRAMDALEAALQDSVDPENDGPRLFSPAPRGEFLLMPAQGDRFSGLKALTVAPENPDRGLEKIQGLYILLSSDTLGPVAVMEGSSLTAIRTPAVAISAVRQIAAAAPLGDELPTSPRVLVFGAGTQALSHIRAAKTEFPSAPFEVAGRRPERVTGLIDQLRDAHGITATALAEGALDDAVAAADIIICATTTSAPLFDGALVRDGAIVAAIGTHGLELREVDDAPSLAPTSWSRAVPRRSARTAISSRSTPLAGTTTIGPRTCAIWRAERSPEPRDGPPSTPASACRGKIWCARPPCSPRPRMGRQAGRAPESRTQQCPLPTDSTPPIRSSR